VAFLIDTNVLSELRKAVPHPNVAAWAASVDSDSVYLSVLVAGEIRQGVEMLRRRDPGRAEVLDGWLDDLLASYADRTVAVDARVGDEWGRLNAAHGLPVIDGLLAATARVHGWTLVTRNVRDVERTGVRCLDPFMAPA
jgi:hypothetical protein